MARLLAFGVVLATAAVSLAVEVWPLPACVDRADEFTLRVDGTEVPLMRMPEPDRKQPGHNPHRFAVGHFAATGVVNVAVGWPGGGTNFTARTPFYRSLEPFGRSKPLVVLGDEPQTNAPTANAPGVRYFGPGLHKPGQIVLKSNETLVVAGGAWVEAGIVAEGDNIRVCGNGVLSGAPWPHWGGPSKHANLTHFSGRNLTIENVTFWSSPGWTVVLWGVENAVLNRVKVVNGRTGNDDGIDLMGSRNVAIRDSFVLSGDDCIAPKGFCENLLVEHCTLWGNNANVVRIGHECDGPAHAFRNLVFRDIDVLHMPVEKRDPSAPWTIALVLVEAVRNEPFSNIVFDDIRFHEPYAKGENFIVLKTRAIDWMGPLAGRISDVTFRRFRTMDGRPVNCYRSSWDAANPIERIRFEETPVTETEVRLKDGK